MSRLNDLLDACGSFFLATIDEEQPKLRPIGAHTENDGVIRFYIGSHKEVYKQLQKNPHCEIGGMVNKGQWIRVTGKAVFDQDDSYAKKYLNEVSPGLKRLYNDQTGHHLASFYLEDMQATLYAMGRILETIEEDQK